VNTLLKNSLNAERHVLDNGLTVLLLVDSRLPLVCSQTVFRVGSRNEHTGITGISHLFEHMMFNGSENYPPGAFDQILESSGGYSNAYTSRDVTVYYESFTPSLLETVITLNADRMGRLTLNEECLTFERDVVMEERRMRTDNSVMGRMDEALFANAYQAHPYRTPVIGWMSDIEKITLEDCRWFFQTYYAPNNAVLAISGDFDPQQALAFIEREYGVIPSQKAPRPVRTVEPEQQGERRIVLQHPAQLPAMFAAYHAPEMTHADVFALDMLQVILSDGDSSRLLRRMIHEKPLAVHVYSDFIWRVNPSLMTFYLQATGMPQLQKAENFLYRELERIRTRGITTKEVRKSRNIISANLVRGMKSIEGRAGKLAVFEAFFDGYEEIFSLPEAYAQVTSEDIQRVAAQYLQPAQRTVLIQEPTNGQS
jgi:zinc protease